MSDDANDRYMLLHLFVGEVREKCAMIEACFGRINSTLDADAIDSNFDLFFWLQTILLHSSNISLIFWPTKKASAARGSDLRRAFGMEAEIDFLKDRSLRNDIAHLDERLEEWWEESPRKIMIRHLIGSATFFGDGYGGGDIVEHYNPERGLFHFRGNEYDIQALFTCMTQIRRRSNEIYTHSWWSSEFQSYFGSRQQA